MKALSFLLVFPAVLFAIPNLLMATGGMNAMNSMVEGTMAICPAQVPFGQPGMIVRASATRVPSKDGLRYKHRMIFKHSESDPYYKLYHMDPITGGRVLLYSSEMIPNNANPQWQPSPPIAAHYFQHSSRYFIELFDKDLTGSDPIGYTDNLLGATLLSAGPAGTIVTLKCSEAVEQAKNLNCGDLNIAVIPSHGSFQPGMPQHGMPMMHGIAYPTAAHGMAHGAGYPAAFPSAYPAALPPAYPGALPALPAPHGYGMPSAYPSTCPSSYPTTTCPGHFPASAPMYPQQPYGAYPYTHGQYPHVPHFH